jgi:hypothetical protein
VYGDNAIVVACLVNGFGCSMNKALAKNNPSDIMFSVSSYIRFVFKDPGFVFKDTRKHEPLSDVIKFGGKDFTST